MQQHDSHAHNDAHHSHDVGSTHDAYLWGLGLAIILTLASFASVAFHWVWGPSMPILLGVLAVAQMGVHLVFFMHVKADEEGENTVLAVGFGIFVVALVVFGSLLIMNNLSIVMPTMDQLMQMQR